MAATCCRLLFCDRITQIEGWMQKNTVKAFLPECPRSHISETQESEKKAVSSKSSVLLCADALLKGLEKKIQAFMIQGNFMASMLSMLHPSKESKYSVFTFHTLRKHSKRMNTIYYAIKQCTHIILIKAATLSYINCVYCTRQTQKD